MQHNNHDNEHEHEHNQNQKHAKTIYFYKVSDAHGFLSNFSQHPFVLHNKAWRTAEHYYQAQKFAGTAAEEEIRKAFSPAKAKRLGNSRNSIGGDLRKDWDKVKEIVMYEALQAKFTQNLHLKNLLLSTGSDILCERSKKDSYWGDGGNGTGLNRLGELLMKLRNELKSHPAKGHEVHPETHTNVLQDLPAHPEPHEHDEQYPSDFSESDDGLDPNTNQPFEQGEETENGTVETATKSKRKGNAKGRMRKNIWKDQTGGSLFEKDNQVRGQANLVGPGISVPLNVLPSEAKFVIHQNQFRKKYRNEQDESSEEEEEDGETEPSEKPHKVTLGDYFQNASSGQTEERKPEYLTSPQACLALVMQNMSLLQSLPQTDPSYTEIKNNLVELKQVMIQFVDSTQDDQLLMQLLAQIESINEL